MQNTSGILPSASSTADPSPAPTNAEPQPASVISSTSPPAMSATDANTSSARRIVVPRKTVKGEDECASAALPPMIASTRVTSPLVAVDEEPAKDSIAAPVQGNKRRCWTCKSKISLSAVTCRCGYTFCNRHRYAEEHDCLFNFRQLAKRKLEEENPRIVPLKVARIN
ncbi:hypothetical protein H310_00051 [Aphanomyces invadans]|uniref:AN1-type domain-containing protein n=1 Tax=Aphanomyces invadans TaxID=157072 RepID=A0A024USI4_9STRA|nr:hypothetical protein H310_00051 [Aphanomyces invadans]ETW09461.1 hypothetical protein H310_00051 [Aphanomyces invadans]|eukprot:XP_008860872.1 hypothetical protein H310_00051 [Aphanomyces invadans]